MSGWRSSTSTRTHGPISLAAPAMRSLSAGTVRPSTERPCCRGCSRGEDRPHARRAPGHTFAHPILVAPVAYQRLAHPEGERATAMGAAAQDAGLVLSTLSSMSLEDVAVGRGPRRWFQLYLQRERPTYAGSGAPRRGGRLRSAGRDCGCSDQWICATASIGSASACRPEWQPRICARYPSEAPPADMRPVIEYLHRQGAHLVGHRMAVGEHALCRFCSKGVLSVETRTWRSSMARAA